MAKKHKHHTLQSDAASFSRKNYTLLIWCFILVIVAGITFSPSLSNSFTNLDDDVYVTNNPDIQGLNGHNIVRIFSQQYVGNYQPLTMLTYILDYSMSGTNASGYHALSLLLHLLNIVLLFFLLFRLTRSSFIAVIATLLFAVHPLRVESVAWVAERKDVLFTFFYLGALHCYVSYIRSGTWLLMVYTIVLALLSVLSKPMAVSLPVVMLLFDYYLKRPWNIQLLFEKLPVVIIAGVFAVTTMLIQGHIGAITDLPALSVVQRFCVPFYCLLFYLIKTLVPLHLSAYYFFPHTIGKTMSVLLYASPFAVTAGAVLLWYFRAYSRTVVFGLSFMIVTLLPVLQIVPVGGTLVAERYTYISLIGVYLLAAFALQKLLFVTLKHKPELRKTVYVLLFGMGLVMCGLTYQRCEVWKDSFTLWNDVVARHPNALAYNSIGKAYSDLDNLDQTILYATKAIQLDSAYFLAYNNRGSAFSRKGQQNMAMYNNDYGTYKSAIEDFSRLIRLNPDFAHGFSNRANVYSALKQYDLALADYAQSLKLEPRAPDFYYNRGLLYNDREQYDSAIADFNKSIDLNPRVAQVYNDRGISYAQKGNLMQAVADFKASLSIRPIAPDVQDNLNRALSMQSSVSAPVVTLHDIKKQ